MWDGPQWRAPRERPHPNASRSGHGRPAELASRLTARPSTHATSATLEPFLCGPRPTSLPVRNRLLHLPRATRAAEHARTYRRAGSVGKQSARRLGGPPGVARRAAHLRGVSHAAMGGTGRGSDIRRGPPIPSWGHLRPCGDWCQGREGDYYRKSKTPPPGRSARNEPTPVSMWSQCPLGLESPRA